MAIANSFDESVKDFNAKKKICSDFVSKADDLLTRYCVDFPALFESSAKDVKAETAPPKEIITNALAKINNSRLKILIAGQFKTGKSTLINALLGEEVLPAYSTPCTAVITEIHYGPKPRAVLSFKRDIKKDQIPAELAEEVTKYILANLPNVPDKELAGDNLGAQLEDTLVIPMSDKSQEDSVAETPFSLCKLYWPLELCHNDALIIDSPGLNEAYARDETTKNYVPEADIVLYMLNASQCYSQTDRNYLDEIMLRCKAPLFLLINRFDQLNTERDRDRLKTYVQKNVKGNHQEENIFFLSAYPALEGRKNNDQEAIDNAGFSIFQQGLADIVNSDRVKIKLKKPLESVCDELTDFSDNYLQNLKGSLTKNLKELEQTYMRNEEKFKNLEEKRALIKKRIDAEIDRTYQDCCYQVQDFFNYFVHNKLEKIVMEIPVSDIGIFGRKKDTEKVCKEIGESVSLALQKEFAAWGKAKGEKLVRQHINNIKEDIEWELHQFDEQITSLRNGMRKSNFSSFSNIEFEDDMFELMGKGGLFGGGIAGGLMFIAGRFLPILGGPIVWTVAVISTIASAIIAVKTMSQAEAKVKNNAIQHYRNYFYENSPEWTEIISQQIATTFYEAADEINSRLQRRIDDEKNPILEAIQTLKNNKGNIEEKRRKVDDYIAKFKVLEDNGRQILNNI